MRHSQWWAESAHPGWNRVKVSENLGATALVDTSLPTESGLSLDLSALSHYKQKILE